MPLTRPQEIIGIDYEDGSEGGAAVCECGEWQAYVTRLCEPRSSWTLDCGKFHHHCVHCPDFGQCIGDYREAHCFKCGDHYFAGSMGGFRCHCAPVRSSDPDFGGPFGDSESDSEEEEGAWDEGFALDEAGVPVLPPCDMRAFDGVLLGARAAYESWARGKGRGTGARKGVRKPAPKGKKQKRSTRRKV